MNGLPLDVLGLLLMVFLLGLRHGLDADHLAMIDGFSRASRASNPQLARWAGFLFSLGHGAVVTAASVVVGMVATEWATPEWLDAAGTWISVLFLFLLGAINVWSVMCAEPSAVVRPVGLRSRWFGAQARMNQPLLIAGTGALFAFSFDTISQVALFAVAAKAVSGVFFCAGLGLAFTAGMMMTDGINGLWVSKLLQRADRRARVASRVMGLTIGATSVLIALYIAVCATLPETVPLTESGGAASSGLLVIAVVLASFLVAERLAPPEPAKTN
jgi:high-affinity nickel-transport protein